MESSISNEDDYKMIEDLATKLRTYCNNGDISAVALRIFIKDNIPEKHLQDVLREASMLCGSKNISLDIINCLLEYYPEGISVKNGEEYPLHVACMNKHCPSDVIRFLAEKYPAAIRHSSIEDGVKYPVHNYLDSEYYVCPGRKIDMELVLRLIKEYPEAFSKEEDAYYEYEIAEKLAEYLGDYCYRKRKKFSISGLKECIDNIPQVFIHDVLQEASMLCDSKIISLDIIKCLLEYYPEGCSSRKFEEYPLHVACMNKNCPSDVIEFLMKQYPAAIRYSSVEDDVQYPLYLYLDSEYSYGKKDPGRKIDVKIVVMLIKECPEAINKEDDMYHYYEINGKFVNYLNQYCNEDGMSIIGLKEHIENIPQIFLQDVLHEADMLCGSKNVTLDIIKCLLEYYPEGASMEIKCYSGSGEVKAFPIHVACKNKHCPSDVIEFLMKQYPAALRQISIFEDGVNVPSGLLDGYNEYEVSGLPLHYYVSRPSSKMDKETIIKLVNEYPESITKACEWTHVKPIDILLTRGIFGFYSLAKICERKVVTVEKIREPINSIPREQFFSEVCNLPEHLNLLQLVCSNNNVTLDVVEYLLAEYDPDAASREIDAKYFYASVTAYPLHWACMNSSCPDSIIQLLITKYPLALRKASVIDGGIGVDHPISRMLVQDRGTMAGLPLHYYLGREDNIDLDTVKMMVKQYPESLTIAGRENAPANYSALYAPLDILLMNRQQVMNSSEIVKFLIGSNESFLRDQLTGIGQSTLQIACFSFEMDPRTIKLIISTCPELICRTDREGETAVHSLCRNETLPDNIAVEILQLLIEKDPASLKMMGAWPEEMLPIHVAAEEGSSKHIFQVLYDADKESIRARSSQNRLPLHVAARHGNLEAVKCLFDLDPSTLDTHVREGTLFFRDVDIEKDCRSDIKLFLEAQWPYHLKAKDVKSLTVRDEVGQVPLHHALRNRQASLGSIKLLLERKPDSLFIADNDGTLPFHVACGFSTADMVDYLMDHFTVSSFGGSMKDMWGNTPLHYACRFGKCDIVKLLLEKQEYIDSVSVRNDDDNLPIQLLCEAPRLGLKKIDRESTEYTETIWLLLCRCPETVVNW